MVFLNHFIFKKEEHMKKNIKKLLTVTLAASLCIPSIPRSMTNAAASSATFGEAEDISVSQIVTERTNLFNSGWKFFLGKFHLCTESRFQ